jgi:transcriptional regulator with XRE-family HTH domain
MAAPTRAKRRLGAHLDALRVAGGHDLADAARELRTTGSTVSRYESGEVLPLWSAVRILLDLYNASDADRATAEELWENAKEDVPAVRLPTGTSKAFRKLVHAESEAHLIQTITTVMPGLLQGEDFSLAIHASSRRFLNPDTKLERYVATRKQRQRRLEGDEPLQLHALIDEAALRRRVGGADTMRRQFDHLLDRMTWDNITVQVIPEDVGAYGPMSGGSITIVHYYDPDDPLMSHRADATDAPAVYLEQVGTGSWVHNSDDVRRFTTNFTDVATVALSPEETAERIRQEIRVLQGK